jgi:RNA 2',3'-cyclic 3'-phosphodiesterase
MTLLRAPDSDEIILHRLFFALKPSAEALVEIAEERGRIGVAKNHVLDHRLELTLWALDLPMTPTPGTIARLCDAAAKVRGRALRMVLLEAESNGEITVLKPGEPMPMLKAFQQRLALAIADAGIWPNRGFRFDPHVTLAYEQEESFRRPTWCPISWRSHEFVLIHSLVGLTEHVELGRWSLEG